MIPIKGNIVKKEKIIWQSESSNTNDVLLAVALINDLINGKPSTSDEKVLSCVISGSDTVSQVNGVTLTFGKDPNTLKACISLKDICENITDDTDDLPVNWLNDSSLDAFKLDTKRSHLPNTNCIKELHKGTVTTTRTSKVLKRLQNESDVALIGQSASGKTVTAAQVSTSLIIQGWTVSWLDLSEPERNHIDILLHFIRTPIGKVRKHLIVLDDIQSNPSEAVRIFQLIKCLKSMTNSKLVLLIVGWNTATTLIKETFQDVFEIQCHGEELLVSISKAFPKVSLDDKKLNEIRSISCDDLLIAKQIFQHLEITEKFPLHGEIAASAYGHATANFTLSRDAVRLLYQLSVLGKFEIDASVAFAESISTEGLRELLELKTIRLNGEFLSVGHRSLANMIICHLYNTRYQELDDLPAPDKLAVEYLRTAGDKQILTTLERLDLANYNLVQKNQHEKSFLVRVWTSFKILINHLAKQNEIDSSWGDNLSSAVFAAEAFAEISHEGWFSTAQFIRSRWKVSNNGDLPTPNGKTTREISDYEEILKRMKDEDDRLGSDTTIVQRADTIDINKFHRTHILGILLGFEGTSLKPDYQILKSLKDAAEKALEPDGSFYPYRVPWITARMVLGLCASGESKFSHVIREACDWLRTPYPEGPYRQGFWESDTGSFNTNLMTTAMCVIALVRSGFSIKDNAVVEGINYLLSQRSDWICPGKEIDGVLSMEAVLLVRGNWREISRELSHILSWARNRESWTPTYLFADDSQYESSKVPFIACSLIRIIWEIVKTELPLLFEGLSSGIREDEQSSGEKYDFNQFTYIFSDCLSEIKQAIDKNIENREYQLKEIKNYPDKSVDIFGNIGNKIGFFKDKGNEMKSRSYEYVDTSSPIEEKLAEWRDKQTVYYKIEENLRSIKEDRKYKDENLLDEMIKLLNSLGQECIGSGWKPMETRLRDINET